MSCYCVSLPLCSVDHLCAGCSSHTDSHSHGGKAAAAHHSKVSTVGECWRHGNKHQISQHLSVVRHFHRKKEKSVTFTVPSFSCDRLRTLWDHVRVVFSWFMTVCHSVVLWYQDYSRKTRNPTRRKFVDSLHRSKNTSQNAEYFERKFYLKSLGFVYLYFFIFKQKFPFVVDWRSNV